MSELSGLYLPELWFWKVGVLVNPFTHIDKNGDAVMVDVSGKTVTSRTAIACGRISMSRECYDAVKAGAMKKATSSASPALPGLWAPSGRVNSFRSAIS